MNTLRSCFIPSLSLHLILIGVAASGTALAQTPVDPPDHPETHSVAGKDDPDDPDDPKKQENETRREQEAQAAEELREKQVEEIEQASQKPWVERWRRFRHATRDISEWNLKDGMFRMRFGLRLQIDLTDGKDSEGLADSVGEIQSRADLRRARLFADGDFLRRFHFRFEYDFAADAGLKDAYVDNLLRHTFKVVALRAGNMKEPFSLERHTSGYFNAFLETSLPVATFAPGRNLGFSLYGMHLKGRLSWEAGSFTNSSSSQDNQSNSNLTFTARITGLPLYRQDGKRLLHLGAAYSLRSPKGNSVRYETRPEARFTPFFLDTGDLAASSAQLFGLEIAGVHGPFWAQAELIDVEANLQESEGGSFRGGYGQVGWFLTGESRPYVKSDGTFGRLEPIRPFKQGNRLFHSRMGGALELAGRVSWVNLDGGDAQTGKMADLTFGVNWYMTRATRLMFNYVRSRVNDVGHANVYLIRYQFNPGYHWPPLDPQWRHHGQADSPVPE